MMHKNLLLLLLLPLLCQAQPGDKTIDVALPIKKAHEECLPLNVGQTLTFQFEANAELDFNLHYHQGNDITYPLKGKYSSYSNTYVAEQKNDFCLMWQNTSDKPASFQVVYRVN